MPKILSITTKEQIKKLSVMAKHIWTKHFTPIIGAHATAYMVDTFQSAKAITKDIKEDGFLYFFILDNKKEVGYFSYRIQDKEFFLSKLYIQEDNRGQGLGANILNHMINTARVKECEKIWLHCNRLNKASLNVYRKLGFEIVSVLDREVGNGFIAEDYVLERPITQIKNIIFDMGNVLVDFKLDDIIGSFVAKADIDTIKKGLFESGIWEQLDIGVSEATVISKACEYLPMHLYKAVADIIAYYPEKMPHNTDMALLAANLNANGYKLYLLSNVGIKFHEYSQDIKAIKYMSGVIASADYKCKKPDEEIFKILLEKFNLNPFECFFIDDLPQNIKAGNHLGIDGVVFTNISELKKSLTLHNIHIYDV